MAAALRRWGKLRALRVFDRSNFEDELQRCGEGLKKTKLFCARPADE
jgi:hypothetical protein